MPKKYDESSIQILEGLEAVRKRPAMYIGSTDSNGLHHLVYEIVDNAIDEVLAGYGKEITVTIKEDNSVEVSDQGRGMPYKMHPSGRPTTEVILTILHAGGKFSDEGGYKVSGGLHGVGSSVVNALSVFLEVTIYRDNKIHQQRFSHGGLKIGKLQELGETKKTGTTIWFKPDPSIFQTTVFSYNTIKERLREAAFLIKGLKITLVDKRKYQREVFYYEDGLISYLQFLANNKKIITNPYEFSSKVRAQTGKKREIEIDIAMQYVNADNEAIFSFVNNVRTKDGGSHDIGFKTALTRSINDYARKYSLIKEKDPNIDGEFIREGILAIISLRIPEDILEFEGQTKSKLGTPEARTVTESISYEHIFAWLEENKSDAEIVIKKAITAQKAWEAGKKAREDAKLNKQRNKKEVSLSGKLVPTQGKDKTKNELFIVEGDSAGGSAKQGRNREFQAILPLRGKVLNTEKLTAEQILKNEEINAIIYSIGGGFGEEFDLKKVNYNKIIIMTDADDDGSHIQILLLTFFFRFMPQLIKAERVYIAMPPLYKTTKKVKGKDEINYFWQDIDLNNYRRKNQNFTIQRFKGLGEMNYYQLWSTTMDPKTRTLIKVQVSDLMTADRKIDILMGDDPKLRRDWIEQNVDFSSIDTFETNNN